MPGTLVSDANEANILTGATLNSAGSTNSTAVQLDRPAEVSFVLETGTVTGTTPTISIVVVGSDDNTFATGVVTYGTITLLSGTAASQSNVTKFLQARVYHKYVRAAVTLGGTSPVYTGSTLKAKAPDWHRTKAGNSAAV